MVKVIVALGCTLLATSLAHADPAPGECSSGFCGTPNDEGGGGCGCGGGSILVNNTDFGITYSTSDDYDADGFEDDSDNCPFIANRDQANDDGDVRGNACDNAPQLANDDQKDTDGDGIGDVVDDDDDGDNIPDSRDNCAAVRNVSQLNTDGDALGDACDADIDNDGALNKDDKCPLRADIQSGDACDADADADHIPDSRDNCLEAANQDQLDLDADGLGDACDFDVDGDGVLNSVDSCARLANAGPAGQADADHDGAGDMCDPNGFCLVAAKNPSADCLDPASAFQVTAGPSVNADTGGETYLALYANRQNVAIRYTFTITERPPNSVSVISNPRGTAQTSEAYEYRFDDTHRPKFTPDVAGTYTITVNAELVSNDDKFPSFTTATSFATVKVEGDPKVKGCSSTSGTPLAFAALGLLLVARYVRRRA